MAEYEKIVHALLREHGCVFVRHGGRGDHDVWRSPVGNRNFVVDSKIRSRHTANTILKQAGVGRHL